MPNWFIDYLSLEGLCVIVPVNDGAGPKSVGIVDPSLGDPRIKAGFGDHFPANISPPTEKSDGSPYAQPRPMGRRHHLGIPRSLI